ncbi:sensor histidine kinase [Hymenobacter arizonensis]|uniref:Histidine kinase n=1 Tax=Hymenobacter arizonensis TaxID=1227077 RepID=A0A1I6AB02_HYMAR|nr:sensor histidine kinase [Hymenobacter arizonensis]SFQ65894.1 Histidine kinase [Hymenobacter arizonensis]
MKLQLQRPCRSDLLLVGVYWLLAAPIIFYSYQHQTVVPRAIATILYTILLDSVAVYLLVFGFLPLALARLKPWALFGGLVLFVLVDAHCYWLGYHLLLDPKPLHWHFPVILNAVMQHTQSYGMLGILLAGKRYFDVQQRLLLTQKAQTESELRNLKAQIDPHFLFNNLNVLRVLMQHDPAEADAYLTRFAALYRFLIRHKDDDFVPLSDELRFVDEYIYLLRHRFGSAYAFRQELPPEMDLTTRMVVPGTLQLLVENAIKHNTGDDDAPLLITIRADAASIAVVHPRRPKRTAVDSMGTGLTNLRERYRLLTNQEILVTDAAGTFSVAVPLVALATSWSTPQQLVAQ